MNLTDRILVFSRGRLTEEIIREDTSEERIMSAAVRGVSDMSDSSAGHNFSPSFFSGNMGLLIVTFLIFAMIAAGGLMSKSFLTVYNFSNLVFQVVPLALVGIGQGMVLISGGIDLSVGYTISLTTAIASYAITNTSNPVIGSAICIAAGLAIGLANGLLCTKCKIPDLIATLASGIAVNGLALILRPTAGGRVDKAFMRAISYRIGGVLPAAFVFVLVLCAVFMIYLKYFKGGTYLFAVGSNSDAAFISGIRVEKVKMLAYVRSGVLAAMAGLVISARIGSGDPRIGNMFTMSSVTAAVVGGISLLGGKGKLPGVVIGAVMFVFTENILNMIQVSPYYQYVCIGTLLLVAVVLYQSSELFTKIAGVLKNNRAALWKGERS
jgi:ribose/xylose/arabinose/galactoside ABC-type transport system permease subunit